jgi:hypothetical protein
MSLEINVQAGTAALPNFKINVPETGNHQGRIVHAQPTATLTKISTYKFTIDDRQICTRIQGEAPKQR